MFFFTLFLVMYRIQPYLLWSDQISIRKYDPDRFIWKEHSVFYFIKTSIHKSYNNKVQTWCSAKFTTRAQVKTLAKFTTLWICDMFPLRHIIFIPVNFDFILTMSADVAIEKFNSMGINRLDLIEMSRLRY